MAKRRFHFHCSTCNVSHCLKDFGLHAAKMALHPVDHESFGSLGKSDCDDACG